MKDFIHFSSMWPLTRKQEQHVSMEPTQQNWAGKVAFKWRTGWLQLWALAFSHHWFYRNSPTLGTDVEQLLWRCEFSSMKRGWGWWSVETPHFTFLVIFILLLTWGGSLSCFDSPSHNCLLDVCCLYSLLQFSCDISSRFCFNHNCRLLPSGVHVLNSHV